MQFSPKKTDFYISALRLYIQKMILKHEISEKNLLRIKKIEQIRIINNFNEVYKTNITQFTVEFCTALTAKFLSRGKAVFFHIRGDACGGINVSAFEGLFCEIAKFLCERKSNSRVNIKIDSHFIEITADEIITDSYINKLIQILNGTVITVKNRYGIKIPIITTKKTYTFLLTAKDYIENPFSAVNLAVVGIKFSNGN